MGSVTANVVGSDSSAWAGLDVLASGFTDPAVAGGTGHQESKTRLGVIDEDDWGLSNFGTGATVRAVSGMNGSTNSASTTFPKPDCPATLSSNLVRQQSATTVARRLNNR